MDYYSVFGVKVYVGTNEELHESYQKKTRHYDELFNTSEYSMRGDLPDNTSTNTQTVSHSAEKQHDERQKKPEKKWSSKRPITLTELRQSTITIDGSIVSRKGAFKGKKFPNAQNETDPTLDVREMESQTDLLFHEANVTKLSLMNCPSIKYICSNYGSVTNADYYTKSDNPTDTKKRGRKPKVKVNTRKMQGSGTCFNSQMQCVVIHFGAPIISAGGIITYSTFKIKLFRTGKFQCPGIHSNMFYDIFPHLMTLKSFLEDQLNVPIAVTYIISVMRNYICTLNDSKSLLFLDKLERVFRALKTAAPWHGTIASWLNSLTKAKSPGASNKQLLRGKDVRSVLKMTENHNPLGIAEIIHNSERYVGLIVKFNRPMPWLTKKKGHKTTTIKILRSGKVNFDGGNSYVEIYELYKWLNYILKRNQEVIYIESEDSDTSSGSGQSIYDSSTDEEEEMKKRLQIRAANAEKKNAKKRGALTTAALSSSAPAALTAVKPATTSTVATSTVTASTVATLEKPSVMPQTTQRSFGVSFEDLLNSVSELDGVDSTKPSLTKPSLTKPSSTKSASTKSASTKGSSERAQSNKGSPKTSANKQQPSRRGRQKRKSAK